MADEKKSPLREITQPFVDLIHAPRALWGINLAYVVEGMCYFGVLGYLAIHFSDFVFQSVGRADDYSHTNVMVLTAGITIAMFFLGFVADKWGVRFALISAFVLMLGGRAFMSAAPTVLGLEPPRPGVFAGDTVSLHVTQVGTRDQDKTITEGTVIANDLAGPDLGTELVLDLSVGEGITPSKERESRLVALSRATLLKGKGQEWEVQYGSAPVTAQLLIHTAEELGLRAGATISLRRAYVAESKKEGASHGLLGFLSKLFAGDKEEEEKETFIIRSHWLEDVVAVDTFPVDLSAGEGVAPDASFESRVVRLRGAKLVEGEGDEWQVQYGSKPVTAPLLIPQAGADRGLLGFLSRLFAGDEELGLCLGATISLNRAEIVKRERDGDEFVIRCDRLEDIAAVDTAGCGGAPAGTEKTDDGLILDLAVGEGIAVDASLEPEDVQLGEAKLVAGEGREWQIQYGSGRVTAWLLMESAKEAGLCVGATISLSRAKVIKPDKVRDEPVLQARWPKDVAAINTFGCAESPYRTITLADEKPLKSETRWPVTKPGEAAREARRVGIAELRRLEDGPANVVLHDVHVAYVRNGGYSVQSDRDGPAIFAFINPLWSPLHWVTIGGILLVVIGYGMYQPAAYAAVRKFTTPKTAAMGFAMLYALMNLGGWLPTFAFLLRDEDFLNLGIPGVWWVYTACTLFALLVTIFILSRRTVEKAVAQAKAETEAIEKAEGKSRQDKPPDEAPKGSEPLPAPSEGPTRVPVHLWLFVAAVLIALLVRIPTPWNFIVCGIVAVAWIVCALIPRTASLLARHPLANGKFFYFIFALIPVQTLFTYNWLILPQYISRAFEGWIGDYFEIAANANPILIFIAVPIIAAITLRAKVYNMMIYGTFIMGAPAFFLVIGPQWWTLVAYILIMTIGEAMWQPRFLQYAAEIAPEGQTGMYMGVAQLPWFLTKMLVPALYSGWMMDRYCPTDGEQNTQFMWLVFACIAMVSTILLILAKGWLGKDFKTKAD